jgi:hypothetical protein
MTTGDETELKGYSPWGKYLNNLGGPSPSTKEESILNQTSTFKPRSSIAWLDRRFLYRGGVVPPLKSSNQRVSSANGTGTSLELKNVTALLSDSL